MVASHGMALADAAAHDFRRDKGLLGEAVAVGEPVLARDLRAIHGPEALALAEAGVRGAMVVPLPRPGPEGVVCLGALEPRDFTPEDVALARLVARRRRSGGGQPSGRGRDAGRHGAPAVDPGPRGRGRACAGPRRHGGRACAASCPRCSRGSWVRARALRERARTTACAEALGVLEEAAWARRRHRAAAGRAWPSAAAGAGELTDARTAAEDALAQLRARAGAGGRPRVDLAPSSTRPRRSPCPPRRSARRSRASC